MSIRRNNEISRRILSSKSLYITILIGCVIVVLDQIAVYKRYNYDLPLPPQNAFMSWMGFINTSVYSFIFFTILPLLVVLPAVGMFCSDIKNGYYRQLVIRHGKKQFYLKWGRSIFFAGFVVVFATLLFSFLVSLVLYPCLMPDSYTGAIGGRNSYLFRVFYYYPFLYTVIYILLNSLMGGVLSLIAAGSYFVFYNTVVAMLFPFIIYYLLSVINGIWDLKYQICPADFLKPAVGISTMTNLCTLVSLVIVAACLWFFASHRKDEEIVG